MSRFQNTDYRTFAKLTHKQPIYHGTTAPDLKNFRLGQNKFGELDNPINGIWLGTAIEGAFNHARRRCRGFQEGHVYACQLHIKSVVADTREHMLPAHAQRAFILNYMGFMEKLLLRLGLSRLAMSRPWLHYAQALAHATKSEKDHTNALIHILSSIGVDVLLNPSTEIGDNGQLLPYDDGGYGTVALLLNVQKATITGEVFLED